LNPEAAEYKAVVLATSPRSSVSGLSLLLRVVVVGVVDDDDDDDDEDEALCPAEQL
jgi:hypothetical protein